MLKVLVTLLVLHVSLLLPSWSFGVRIRVSQESYPNAGDFREHVVGHIEPLLSPAATIEDFYAYDDVFRFSFNGRQPPLRSETSHLFFVHTDHRLSLFLIHDAVNNLDGGSAVMDIRVIGDPDGVRILLKDDAYSASDAYESTAKGTVLKAWHNWYPCCTDGLVAGTLEGNWKAFVRFAANDPSWGQEAVQGLRSWEALSHRGRLPLQLEPGRRVLLEPVGLLVRGTPPVPLE